MYKLKLGLSRGFSFTEMSVVLASIAAIVVVAVGGSTVLDRTKNKKVISQISDFSTAIEKFEKEYGSLPGDIANVAKLPGATPGDGNGAIDTESEAINLWNHLAIAKLTEGTYDGNSVFEPGVGVPSADIEGGGYKVRLADTIAADSVSEQSIAIELAGFNPNNNNDSMAIITAEDAITIDKKLDDGNPRQGIVLAEGDDEECVTSDGKYNLSMEKASCRLIFVIRGSEKIDTGSVTGACSELGQTRELSDTTQKCPDGYEGKIIETCRIDENKVGEWEVMDRKCEEVRCSDGGLFGDTRRLACINEMEGTGITQRCNENGIWITESTDCNPKESISCEDGDEIKESLGCGLGEEGYVLQTCKDNKWKTTKNTCDPTQCDFKDIGESENSGLGCGPRYNGRVNEVCTISGEWEVTSVGSTCVPDYSGSCTAEETKQINCPLGKTGTHTLICVAGDTNYWTTLRDTCAPITCDGGETVGSYRIKEGAACSNGASGTVIEYCDADGIWQVTEQNCVSGICDATDDLAGNAYWPTTKGGTTAKSKKCNDGYEVSGSAKRICNADGTWGAVIQSCERIKCPAGKAKNSTPTKDDDATYPEIIAGESNINGTCDASKNYKGTPIADCSIKGKWNNERLSCRKVCPTKIIANATYNEVFAGINGVTGVCKSGYSGSPTMDCDIDGKWVNQVGACVLDAPKPIIYCPASEVNNATYPKTEANTNKVSGVCMNGYEGSPTLDCKNDGKWGNEKNACTSKIDHYKATIADMVMWFDAQDNNTVFRNNTCTGKARPGIDNVGCWKDKSGNRYHAKQSTSSLRPKYSSYKQGKNGYPVMQFDKDIIYYPYKSHTAGFSLFVMHKDNKYQYTDGYMTILGSNGDVERNSVWLTYDKSPSKLMLYRGFDKYRHTFSYTYKKNVHNISTVLYNKNKIDYYRNGRSEGGGNNIADKKDKDKLTQWGPGGIGGWKSDKKLTEHYFGDIGEVVLYDKRLSLSEMRKVEEYLGDKWDIKMW